ncbi:unnamed protein product [[Candida] boidinii]|uniref:Unnamed protein product n=1 Tax=Candida boidinii TaxID=5477 RepID=A0ACB5TEJ2_CANBO|nr:unnamed protein product [[Candida] boidinii]
MTATIIEETPILKLDPSVLQAEAANIDSTFLIRVINYFSDAKKNPTSKSLNGKNKRKRDNLDDLPNDDSLINSDSIEPPLGSFNLKIPKKFIQVADTTFTCTHTILDQDIIASYKRCLIKNFATNDDPNLESQNEFLITPIDVMFSIEEDGLIKISTIQKHKMKSLNIMNLKIDDFYFPLIQAHFHLLKATKVVKQMPNKEIEKPILYLSFNIINPNELKISIKIHYKIKFQESINVSNTIDNQKKIQDLFSILFHDDLTTYQKGNLSSAEIKAYNDRESSIDQPRYGYSIRSLQPPEFYEVITKNTQKNYFDPMSHKLSIPGLRKTLLGFQRQSLHWLLEHENVILNEETLETTPIEFFNLNDIEKINNESEKLEKLIEKISISLDKIAFGWSRIRSIGGELDNIFYNASTGNICTLETAKEYLLQLKDFSPPAKGLLAEEMGLGKTIEVISLIKTNKRKNILSLDQTKIDPYNSERSLFETKSTLIICPETIIGQWKQEIQDITSELSVTIYEGVFNYEKQAEYNNTVFSPKLLAKKLTEYDIILVSYKVVANEVYRASYNPTSRPKRQCTKRTVSATNSSQRRSKKALDAESKSLAGELINSGNTVIEGDEYIRRDYSSPLVYLEFWRIVLDEVQMTSNAYSNASQIARVLPRVHAWGVSGTVIRNSLHDLWSLFSFLRLYPLGTLTYGPASPMRRLLDEKVPFLAIRLIKSIVLRHTKKMVAEQIKLPPQSRYLLTTPFTAIEQDNYNNQYELFLDRSRLDINGNLTSDYWTAGEFYPIMRQWLSRLRQLCCHARIGSGSTKKRFGTPHGSNEKRRIGTLEEVLRDVQDNARDEVLYNERLHSSLKIKSAKILEFLRKPELACAIFEELIPVLLEKIQQLKDLKKSEEKELVKIEEVSNGDEKSEDKQKNQNKKNNNQNEATNDINNRLSALSLKIRSWNELLYQSYFLLASSYYQRYRPMSRMPEKFDSYGEVEEPVDEEDPDGNSKLKTEIIDPTKLRPDELVFYNLENDYYSKADELLNEILGEPISKIQNGVEALNKKLSTIDSYKLRDLLPKKIKNKPESAAEDSLFKISTIDDKLDLDYEMIQVVPLIEEVKEEDTYYYYMKTRLFLEKYINMIKDLNRQSNIINSWVTTLYNVLKKPVVENDSKEKTGEEYSESLKDQEVAHTYLEVLQVIIQDRNAALFSVDETTSIKIMGKNNNSLSEIEGGLDVDLQRDLESLRKDSIPRGALEAELSFKSIMKSAQLLIADLKHFDEKGNSRYSTDYQFLNDLNQLLKENFESQKEAYNSLKKNIFDMLNQTYNNRIDYFRSLQMKSDGVINYKPVSLANNRRITPKVKAEEDLQATNEECDKTSLIARKAKIRLNYLISLTSTVDELTNAEQLRTENNNTVESVDEQQFQEEEDEDRLCVICRGTIVVGILTSCGHQYCKACLEEWTRNKNKCPMCTQILTPADMYSFTVKKQEISGNLLEEGEKDPKAVNKDNMKDTDKSSLYTIYKPMGERILNEIQSIVIAKAYGSKLDLLVRHILWLKKKDNTVQVVIFSQWAEFLHLISVALRQNDISCLGTNSNSTAANNAYFNDNFEAYGGYRRQKSKNQDIDLFKKDNRFTCFLLNSKAQAAGITLVNASHVFLCEPMVNLPLELQAVSRIHRLGQKKRTTVWMLAISDSVEENIAKLSFNKRTELAKKIIQEDRGGVLDGEIDEEAAENAVDSVELSKSLNTMVEYRVNNGELVGNDDLWKSLFSEAQLSKREIMPEENQLVEETVTDRINRMVNSFRAS